LTERALATTDDLWDALTTPCQLPPWFGRNLDAWVDTLRGGVSPVLGGHRQLIIRARPMGLFDPANARGRAVVEICEQSGTAHVEFDT